MTEKFTDGFEEGPAPRQPIFNVPTVIVVLIGSFVAVHLIRQFVSHDVDDQIVLLFAFSPARYVDASQIAGQIPGLVLPGGPAAAVWTFFSHMFLHGNWQHLGFNSLWMLAFGSVVARRFGWLRFLLFTLVTATLGALGSLLAYWGQFSLMIGASGAISGHMAAAIRLMFSAPGGLANMQAGNFDNVKVLPVGQLLRVKGAVIFIGVWLVLNLVFGLSGFGAGGGVGRIAWEAHLGGFLGGLLIFSLFDKKHRTP